MTVESILFCKRETGALGTLAVIHGAQFARGPVPKREGLKQKRLYEVSVLQALAGLIYSLSYLALLDVMSFADIDVLSS